MKIFSCFKCWITGKELCLFGWTACWYRFGSSLWCKSYVRELVQTFSLTYSELWSTLDEPGNGFCAIAVWCLLFDCGQANQVGNLLRLSSSRHICLSDFSWQYCAHLYGSKVWSLKMQDHFAPSGYLKLPNVGCFSSIEHQINMLVWISSVDSYLWLFVATKISRTKWNFNVQAIPDYLEHCKFLPKLNNEIPEKRNTTYKERFSSLENLVLIMVF